MIGPLNDLRCLDVVAVKRDGRPNVCQLEPTVELGRTGRFLQLCSGLPPISLDNYGMTGSLS